MSPSEIQQKFSLPENGGASNHFGDGGGQQWRIQENFKDPAVRDQVQDWFKKPRPLGKK